MGELRLFGYQETQYFSYLINVASKGEVDVKVG